MEDDKTKSQEPSGAAFEQSEAPSREEGMGPERWIPTLRLFWSERSFLIRAAGVGLMISAVVAFAIPKRYATSTRLMPPDSQSSSSMMMMAAMAQKTGLGLGSMAGDLLGLKSSGALFVGMLQSQTIQDQLIEQFELKKVYGKRLMLDARARLSESTTVQEDRKSGIVSITVTDRSPQRAAAIANAYVNELNTMVAQLSTSSAHRERVFLEDRLQSVKRDLDHAEGQLAQFSSKNSTLDIQQQGKAMLDAASNLSGQMIAAESELQGLRQIYTENNARVRELGARVGELRKELDKIGGMDSTLPRGRQGTAGLSDTVTDSSVDMPYPSLRKLPLLGAKYADFYREAKIQETVYELLTQQNELAKVEEAKETPSVKVLDPAEIPEKKSYPPRLIIMILGTCIALGLAAARTIAKTRWREIDPEDGRKVLAQEVFATMKTQMRLLPQTGASLRSRTHGIFSRHRRPVEGGAD
jgi:capsule polysaccharide export protein KpsE/RkpR